MKMYAELVYSDAPKIPADAYMYDFDNQKRKIINWYKLHHCQEL